MKEAHLIVQGKGGVGKTFSSVLLAQYIKNVANEDVHCFDTDPVNATFSRYKALNVEVIDIMTENNIIDARIFDSLIEKIVTQDGVCVVDNGAATFVPLMAYITENNVSELLKESGVRLVLHVLIEGGQALDDCLTGLEQICRCVDAEIVIWLNDNHGRVEDGEKFFTDFNIYKNHKDKIIGIIHLESRNPDTYGKDIKQMTSSNLTFDEVMESSEFTLMPRQRMKTFARAVFEQLEKLPIAANQKTAEKVKKTDE